MTDRAETHVHADTSPLVPAEPVVPEPETVLDPTPVVQPPPAATRNRAGRNLPAAIGVGVGLVALVFVSLYVRKAVFVGVVAIAISLAIAELGKALSTRDVRVPVPPVVVGGVSMLVAAYLGGPDALVVSLFLTCLAVLAWRRVEGPREGSLRDVVAGLFTAAYVPFLAGFAMLLLRADDGADRVVLFILVVVMSDTGGYAAGATLGKHPMAPKVSPKKSWEGFGGSVTACAVSGAVGMPLLVSGHWWQGAVLGLLVVVTATLGDLGESLIKRDLGIKDMGSLLPGHGGMMDRLDSLLPSAPVVYLVLAIALGT